MHSRNSMNSSYTSQASHTHRAPTRSARARVWLTVWPLALLLGTAACESTSAPAPAAGLDTEAAMQDYRAFKQLFTTPGWEGFTALSGRTPLSSSASQSAMSGMAALPSLVEERNSRQFLLDLFASRAELARGELSSVVLISDLLRGRTLIYDAMLGEYAVDSSRTGAPANGVRFITYAVDRDDRPIAGQEIGYADLIDEGIAGDGKIALRLLSVVGDQTVLDYRTTLEEQNGVGQLTVDGFVADGTERLTFSITASGQETGGRETLDLDFSLRLSSRTFEVIGQVRGVSDGANGDDDGQVELTVRHGNNRLAVSLTNIGSTIDGLITLNGRTFVSITGDSDNPTLLGATGDPITGGELLVVLEIVDVIDDVFDLIEELVEPVDNLIVLGWIL